LVIEATYYSEPPLYDWSGQMQPLRQVFAAVGPLIKLSRPREVSGFFVQPKLLTVFTLGWSGAELQAAMNIGYQHVFGSFFIGSSVGAGAGYSLKNSNDSMTGMFGPRWWGSAPEARNHLAWSVDLNLLRIGAAF
jgi:hypothetical protein